MKKIKVMMEIPENWVDVDDPLFGMASMLGDRFEKRLLDRAVEEAVKKLTLPVIEINPEEIKDRMLTIMAERALEDK